VELLASGIMDAAAYVSSRGCRTGSWKINLLGILKHGNVCVGEFMSHKLLEPGRAFGKVPLCLLCSCTLF